jgi:cyd operon protein YbgT
VIEPNVMWYFPWILGLGPAATVGILNPLWYELGVVRETDETMAPPMSTPLSMIRKVESHISEKIMLHTQFGA